MIFKKCIYWIYLNRCNNRCFFSFVYQRKIIETKNTDILPFPIIFMGTIVTFLWLLYGLIINNVFIIVSKLSVFFIFSNKLFILRNIHHINR